eukprot:gnl/Spiro4/13145_TR6968_c0_g1_i1.p1 gnl/Spiro4/13145_TR6968_c0_g1~~gnl/Spiro4/13145_TR6968_c0_g1_i1.p1  ORF type:complete len:520 (+),score=96.36 gnl/Spiro4/13145_TR6968_c0_g1_i1:75-1562(+)
MSKPQQPQFQLTCSMEGLVQVNFTNLHNVLMELVRAIQFQQKTIETLESEIQNKASRHDMLLLSVANEKTRAQVDKMDERLGKEIGRLDDVAKIGQEARNSLKKMRKRMEGYDESISGLKEVSATVPGLKSEVEKLQLALYSKLHDFDQRLGASETRQDKFASLANDLDRSNLRMEELDTTVQYLKIASQDHEHQLKILKVEMSELKTGMNNGFETGVQRAKSEVDQLRTTLDSLRAENKLFATKTALQDLVDDSQLTKELIADQKRLIDHHSVQIEELYSAADQNASQQYVDNSISQLNAQVRLVLDAQGESMSQKLNHSIQWKADKQELSKLEEMLREMYKTQFEGMVAGKMQFKCLSCDRGGMKMAGQQPDEVRAQWPDQSMSTTLRISDNGHPEMMYGSDGSPYKGRRYDAFAPKQDPSEVLAAATAAARPRSSHGARAATSAAAGPARSNSMGTAVGPRPISASGGRPKSSAAKPKESGLSIAPAPLPRV